jgi:hypothetical protein
LFLGAQGSLEAALSDVPPLARIYKTRVPTGLAAEPDLAGPAEGQRGTDHKCLRIMITECRGSRGDRTVDS